jgi:hypothetical protein
VTVPARRFCAPGRNGSRSGSNPAYHTGMPNAKSQKGHWSMVDFRVLVGPMFEFSHRLVELTSDLPIA